MDGQSVRDLLEFSPGDFPAFIHQSRFVRKPLRVPIKAIADRQVGPDSLGYISPGLFIGERVPEPLQDVPVGLSRICHVTLLLRKHRI